MSSRGLWILSIMLSLSLAGRASAESQSDPAPTHTRLHAGIGYHFSSGDYGESRSTDIDYVPLIVRGEYAAWTLELTLPYIRIRGPQGILSVIDDSSGDSAAEADGVSTESGLGDIIVAGSHTWFPARSWLPYTEFEVSLKIPTADESKRLGTGEMDITTTLEVAWTLGRFSPFIGFGYEFLGDPGENVAADGTVTGFDLNDAARVSAGFSAEIQEGLYAGAYFDYGAPTSRNAGDRMDVIPFAMLRWRESWMLQTYGSIGLASGSADYGVGVQVGYDGTPGPAND